MNHSATLSPELRSCAQECATCHTICLETVQHCLELGGTMARPEHIAALLACAEICQCSANVLLAGSELHLHTCAACAAICRSCSEDCARLAAGDPMMERCSAACMRCADVCEAMAHAAV